MNKFLVSLFALAILLPDMQAQDSGRTLVVDEVDSVLSQMTLEEKVSQLSGRSFDTEENTRLGILGFHMVDGPLGVGQPDKNGVSTAFPAPIALAATWDTALANEMGAAIGTEARFKHKNVLLAPCMNIQRFYGGGRNFESFSEDPFLSSRMAVGFIKGVQEAGVIACAKHFVCNNQERNRINLNVQVGERALREIYFPSFKAAVQEAGVLAVMTSYNMVNGQYAGENEWLINEVLKKEWGFEGLTISDWVSIYSAEKAYRAGLDMDMPWARHFGDSLLHMLRNNHLPLAPLDDKVRRILHVKNQLSQKNERETDSTLYAERVIDHQKLAKEIAAASMVLLKNKEHLLPLNLEETENIAVIGPNADVARIPNRGSVNVEPPYRISPLQGIYEMMGDSSKVTYAKGCELIETPYFSEGVKVTSARGEPGFDVSFYPNQHLAGEPLLRIHHPTIDCDWGHEAPMAEMGNDDFSIEWTGNVQVPVSGWYSIDVSCFGGYKLEFDHTPLIDQWFVWRPQGIESVPLYLEAGRTYPLGLTYFESEWEAGAKLGIRSLHNPYLKEVQSKVEKTDVAILFLGFSDVYEQEGNDRASFSLPREQLDLLEKVIESGKKVVVVLNAGTPVEMASWIDKVDAVLFAWYGGMEFGNAIAEVLAGKENPSGRLPFTYPRRMEDYPVNTSYFSNDTLMTYSEGIYVGYRYYDKYGVEPLFDFGFGLSYAEFEYQDLTSIVQEDSLQVQLRVKNTGEYAGAEVVQVYMGKQHSQIDRPAYELKGFKKVYLQPGEAKLVTIGIAKKQLQYFDPSIGAWAFEPGVYHIQVGQSKHRVLAADTCIIDDLID
jgi:beta-glucosidase